MTNGDNGYYIHKTLTCYWYYTTTGERIKSCNVAPDKKLTRISLFQEISFDEGFINKEMFDEFEKKLATARKELANDNFSEFVSQLSNLQKQLKFSINNIEMQQNFENAFKDCYYWINMPWFRTD